MNQPSNNNKDPRKLAAQAKAVVQPAPNTPHKVVLPTGKLTGLQNLPKPTQNPQPAPTQQTGTKPTVIQGPVTANDSKQQETITPQPTEVVKKDQTIPQEQKKDEKLETRDEMGRFVPGHVPTGHRPKKTDTIAYKAEQRLKAPHGRLPDGTMVTKADQIANVMIDKAINGDVKAAQFISDITDGKPKQKIEITPPDEAEGTVLANEAQDKLLETFGRKIKHGTDNSTTNQGA